MPWTLASVMPVYCSTASGW